MDLRDFLQSDIDKIAETAKQVEKYKDMYSSGLINRAELQDLLLDITRMDNIDSSLYNFETLAKINEAMKVLGNIKLIMSL